MVKNKSKRVLFKNTLMLYILTFSNYFFNFITVPYQTRVLGPEFYGKLGFALAFITYFQLVLDFGFILSATEDVSKNRDDKEKLSKILTSVNMCKFLLSSLLLVILIILCLTVNRFKEDILIYILYFIYVLINSLLPDFLYRGIEDMKIITYRSIIIRFLFTIAVFVFLKTKEQYYLVPIFNIIGSLISVIAIYYHAIKILNIKIVKVSWKEIEDTLKRSSTFFLSRIATTVYSSTNTFILGFIYTSGNTIGLYTTADKLTSTAKSMLTPISDSIYPYMLKNKDFKLIKRILLIILPIITIGCTIIGIFACPICYFIFGKEYYNTGIILRFMLPLVIIALPSYLLGFPALSPLGLSKYANYTVILGSIFQIVIISILAIIGFLNIYTICCSTIVTELVILIARIRIIIKNVYKRRCIMKRILTYGTYDLLHYGHIRLLKRAKELGDYLIVAVSTDEFNAIKGKKSYHDFNTRKEMLEAIRYVDLVIPESDWEQKRKDVLEYKVDMVVMGSDWINNEKFECLRDICDVKYLERTEGISTSKIKRELNLKEPKDKDNTNYKLIKDQ